jgi:hypothetical protein
MWCRAENATYHNVIWHLKNHSVGPHWLSLPMSKWSINTNSQTFPQRNLHISPIHHAPTGYGGHSTSTNWLTLKSAELHVQYSCRVPRRYQPSLPVHAVMSSSVHCLPFKRHRINVVKRPPPCVGSGGWCLHQSASLSVSPNRATGETISVHLQQQLSQ